MTEKLILSLRLISPQLFYEQLRPRYLVHDPPHPAPIPVIISIFHRWIHNSTLYPSGWDGNWMELELKYNRYQRIYKKEGEITGEKFICIYSWTMEKKKLIHPVENGTEIRRFPSFPRTGNERERNRITGGDDRGKIVVHENIARLTVNDVAWNSEWWWMTLTERRPSTTKKAKKAQRPERNFERRKRADFSHFSIRKSVDRVESREMRRIVRIRLDLSSVIRGTRTYVSRARNGGFITRRRGEVSILFRQI